MAQDQERKSLGYIDRHLFARSQFENFLCPADPPRAFGVHPQPHVLAPRGCRYVANEFLDQCKNEFLSNIPKKNLVLGHFDLI